MLDWPEVIVIGAVIILFSGAVGVCILGIWSLTLWLEWRYGDHARWRWSILDALARRHTTGAFVEQLSYITGLRPEHIERIIMSELVRPDRSLVTPSTNGMYKITEDGLAALRATQKTMRVGINEWCVRLRWE
jgi:hypothetical protein